jgi:phenylalanyl-tRNA synthetase beta chain
MAGDKASGQLPDEYTALGIVTQRPLQYLRGVLENLLERVSPEELAIRPSEIPGFAPGCAARILLSGQEAGQIGVLSQAVLDYYGLEQAVAAMMLRFEALSRHAGLVRTYQSLPKFPPIRRDLSLVLDEAVTWRQVAQTILSRGQAELESIDFVGIYRGKQVPLGKKSLTLSLTYRSADGTLRHELVDQRVAAVLVELTQRLQATLRA